MQGDGLSRRVLKAWGGCALHHWAGERPGELETSVGLKSATAKIAWRKCSKLGRRPQQALLPLWPTGPLQKVNAGVSKRPREVTLEGAQSRLGGGCGRCHHGSYGERGTATASTADEAVNRGPDRGAAGRVSASRGQFDGPRLAKLSSRLRLFILQIRVEKLKRWLQ